MTPEAYARKLAYNRAWKAARKEHLAAYNKRVRAKYYPWRNVMRRLQRIEEGRDVRPAMLASERARAARYRARHKAKLKERRIYLRKYKAMLRAALSDAGRHENA